MTGNLSRICILSLAISVAWVAPTLRAKDDVTSLSRKIDAMVKHERFHRAHIGVKVISLPDGKDVYSHQAQKLFKPASNAKLFTGALVLDRFAPNHRLQTSCYTIGKPDTTGRVTGDLIIYGRGDPSFSPRFHDGDLRKPFKSFAKAIYKAGIRHVTGNITADESYFNIPPFGSGWTWDDLLESYGAEVSALSINDNVALIRARPGTGLGRPCRIATLPPSIPVVVRSHATTGRNGTRAALNTHRPFLRNEVLLTGQLPIGHPGRNIEFTVRRPAFWFARMMKSELEATGIRIDGDAAAVNWRERLLTPLPRRGLHHVNSHTSPSLLELTSEMMKESQNLHAQLLLLQAGMKTPLAEKDTEESAIADLNRFLQQAGIPADEVNLEEGSGLSRRALITPDAIVKLLEHMSRHRRSDAFAATLTVAGRDGTLRNRFRGTSAENNLRGKTGSLTGIKSLSAYVTNKAGQKFAFSILLNYHTQSGASAKSAIDQIAVTIADSTLKVR